MKRYLIVVAILVFASCSRVPDISIFEPLDNEVQYRICRKDSLFSSFYDNVQDQVKVFNEIEKSRFQDITYRGLYKRYLFINDTVHMQQKRQCYEHDWECRFGGLSEKADSLINYWKDYIDKNSLNNLVGVSFSHLFHTYYSYWSNDVKDVELAFRLTPLVSGIEQVRFMFRYAEKINNINDAKWQNYIYTSPFSTSIVRYWKVDYFEERKLKEVATSEFKRDYNMSIVVTDVRRNGKNYSIEDLHIPTSITEILSCDQQAYQYYKDKVITELLDHSYKSKTSYANDKISEYLASLFPREEEFYNSYFIKFTQHLLREAYK